MARAGDHAPLRDRVQELRAACAEISRRARWVRVREDAIAQYAAALEPGGAPDGADHPDSPDAQDPADAPDSAGDALDAHLPRSERAAYWLTLDAINFGSGWFPTLRKPAGRSGYATVSSAWRARWETDGPLSPAELTELTAADLAAILGQDPAHELMELFARSLRDLGARLRDGFDGDPLGLIDAAGGSAVALALELGGWPCFADHSRYQELSVPFLKRAQIAAADLQRAGVVTWRDGERLTMFADNLVPHVLRLDGVLTFDPALIARIDAGELIEHGSPQEVEIRAGAVEAVERIVAARGGALTAAEVDQRLWERGQGSRYKSVPRHRSRCTAY